MDDATNAVQSAKRSAAVMADDVSRRARDAMDKAGIAAERASEWMREQRLAENATAYVTANPAKAIGAAVVAGALLAYLFTRKKNWP